MTSPNRNDKMKNVQLDHFIFLNVPTPQHVRTLTHFSYCKKT